LLVPTMLTQHHRFRRGRQVVEFDIRMIYLTPKLTRWLSVLFQVPNALGTVIVIVQPPLVYSRVL